MVPGIVLAAGYSSRMGRDKALLPIPGGGWFLARLVSKLLAGGCDRVVAVVSPSIRTRVDLALRREPFAVTVVVNEDPSRGQLSSLQEALRVTLSWDADAALVCPVDHPLIGAPTVAAVLAAWRRDRAAVVRPSHLGRHGHPVLFDRRVFPELLAADLAGGARPVVKAHAHDLGDVEVDDPGAFDDIDTPDDYCRTFGVALLAAGAPPA